MSTTSLGSLLQCFTILAVKNLLPVSNFRISCLVLNHLPFHIVQTLIRSLSPSLLQALLQKATVRSPQMILLFRLNYLNSHLIFVGEMLQPSGHPHGPSLDPLQQVDELLEIRALGLNAEQNGGPAGRAAFGVSILEIRKSAYLPTCFVCVFV